MLSPAGRMLTEYNSALNSEFMDFYETVPTLPQILALGELSVCKIRLYLNSSLLISIVNETGPSCNNLTDKYHGRKIKIISRQIITFYQSCGSLSGRAVFSDYSSVSSGY